MKPMRILQIVLAALALVYLLLLHNQNQATLSMPFFLSMPPALVVGITLVLGLGLGWVWGRLALWRQTREMKRLNARIAELEQHLPNFGPGSPAAPIIPDREAERVMTPSSSDGSR